MGNGLEAARFPSGHGYDTDKTISVAHAFFSEGWVYVLAREMPKPRGRVMLYIEKKNMTVFVI